MISIDLCQTPVRCGSLRSGFVYGSYGRNYCGRNFLSHSKYTPLFSPLRKENVLLYVEIACIGSKAVLTCASIRGPFLAILDFQCIPSCGGAGSPLSGFLGANCGYVAFGVACVPFSSRRMSSPMPPNPGQGMSGRKDAGNGLPRRGVRDFPEFRGGADEVAVDVLRARV